MENLPIDILFSIFDLLDGQAIIRLAKTERRMNRLILLHIYNKINVGNKNILDISIIPNHVLLNLSEIEELVDKYYKCNMCNNYKQFHMDFYNYCNHCAPNNRPSLTNKFTYI